MLVYHHQFGASVKLNVGWNVMGLDINGTKFLLHAKSQGVSFNKTAMIGRQQLLVTADALRNNLAAFGYSLQTDEANQLISQRDGYAEPFLEKLGATEIVSFDNSEYENADYIFDFNFPVPDNFKNRFTVVLDGGTLEHIFNFSTSIKNCMEMIEVGGYFLGITPTNNFLGHGFYQFSPELFFRIFNTANGFNLSQMILFEDSPDAKWYEVADPDKIKERVILANKVPTYLLIIAKKTASVEIFATPPQQSDYVELWKSAGSNLNSKSALQPLHMQKTKQGLLKRTARMLYDFLPAFLKRIYRNTRRPRSYNPRHFRHVRIPKT